MMVFPVVVVYLGVLEARHVMPVRICWYMWLDCVDLSREVGPRSLLIDMQVSWSVESPADVVATTACLWLRAYGINTM